MVIRRVSKLTGIEHEMDLPITDEQIARYRAGALVQVAFPNLDADQREFFMNGITTEEWDKFMGEEVPDA